jgi:hypothetical protein
MGGHDDVGGVSVSGHGRAARRTPGYGLVVRQPARIVEGRPEGGYTDEFEII